jgi:hypothetical protein
MRTVTVGGSFGLAGTPRASPKSSLSTLTSSGTQSSRAGRGFGLDRGAGDRGGPGGVVRGEVDRVLRDRHPADDGREHEEEQEGRGENGHLDRGGAAIGHLVSPL